MKQNLIGQKYGRLTIIQRAGADKNYNPKYLCRCDCGNQIISIIGNLKKGNTKSCGCLRSEGKASVTHGHASNGEISLTYRIWRNMKNRCLNPNLESYVRYGGRGITVCERWLKFENFLKDMGEAPQGMTIERIENNKGYSPDNCKWASRLEQGNNKRNNALIWDDIQFVTLSQFARNHNLDYKKVWRMYSKTRGEYAWAFSQVY